MANTPAKTSSFAVTCCLLSQYMKEKGTRSLADLGLSSLAGKPDSYRPPTTMSLLPGMDVSGDKLADKTYGVSAAMELFPQRGSSLGLDGPAGVTRKPEKAQLTIFYGGKVLVFDNFPSDKASDLMQLAGKKSGTANNLGIAPPVVATAAVTNEAKSMASNQSATPVSAPNSPQIVKTEPQKAAQVTVSNLPIARKASLHRFLEKRKDRINAKAPYQVKDSPSKDSPADLAKADGSQPWLGLKTKPELEA